MQAKILTLIALLAMGICGLLAQNDMVIIAQINGEHHRSWFGSSMASLDFNHDGYDDLIVCARNYGYLYPSTPGRGKVYVYYGGPDFNAETPPAMTLEGTYNGTSGRTIGSVHNIGDVNGDGFEDLCLYDYDPNIIEDSKLQIFFGSCIDLVTPDLIISIPGYYYLLSTNSLGDFNGDGFDDIGLGYSIPSIGRIYTIYFDIVWGGDYEQETVSSGEANVSYVSSINGIGDINNDGYDDFAIGFSGPSTNASYNLIRLYYGNQAGSVSNPVTLIQTTEPVTHVSVPLGDMNSDGYDDFMGYLSNFGMHAWLGGQSINYTTPSFNLSPVWCGGEFAGALVYGDFNSDGYSDVIGADNVEKKFSLWLGRQNVNGTSDFIYHRPGSTNFGYTLAAGDFNADGFDDLAVSAPFENSPPPQGTFYGFVWIHAGNAELEDTTVAIDDSVIPGVGEQFTVSISPNPVHSSSGFVTVKVSGTKLPESAQGTAEIFNIRGQRVFSTVFQVRAQSATATLTVTELPTGVYTCRVTVAGSIATHRFTRLF